MRKRLRSVLSLLESHTQEELIFNFLEINQRRPRFEALMAGVINTTEKRMECYAVSGTRNVSLQRFEVSLLDVNHPLIHVLRSGVNAIWQTLHRGVRIEESRFRQFVCELPNECGLFATPVFDHRGAASGVIAAFSCQPEQLNKPNSVFSLSCELFRYQLKKAMELEQLHRQLRQIQTVFHTQQQRQKQLDELIAELSSTGDRNPPGIAKDYSGINDLLVAIEEFECNVLTQRLRQFNANKKRVAESLNLSPRTLAYKLTKYGCDV
ncbi:helix-turn-helix domain-containing protein [Trabulsiella odontotermitis]|uniref:DNA binding HTH domain-containing protein n=1 Tax=Trabulsiella odontotermitis TaxID=379893 RepID=A0A0L0GLR9_9ENTR|nr:helix-turn-helix domain-containing protein [Trabulsiella odontotermitis]KNC89674.1 hypothetical protein GM30_06535 [Trabulsiella odontotermitis]KNC90005.1 hypothetical protein GM31_06115 [Trabulsiella odontotermitis]